jgi:CPA2 family monovalent cation:H+ antiporter-2
MVGSGMHHLNIVITLAAGLAVALLFGALTRRIGLSTLVGYLLAGVVVGPYTPGFVADQGLASQLAEIGVILLMFGVGLHFHPQELLRVWRLAVPGAVGQSLVAGCAGWAMARWLGWSNAAGVVFGMALAVASTVVLMRMLVERGRLSTPDGHAAVGWLIVEDLFTVAALVVLPVLAAPRGHVLLSVALGLALLKVGAFALIVALAGTRVVSRLLERMARTRSSELFTLSVFVVALGVAALAAEVFHVSVALGAFFAGLVVGQSRFGPQAAADMAPFRDVFSALFFVSVGMLFDPGFIMREPATVLGVLAVVLVLKPLVAWAIVLALRGSVRTAATVAVGLAQIGEFSFILASLGVASGVLPGLAMDALVVGAIGSIAVNPLLFTAADRLLERRGRAVPQPAAAQPGPPLLQAAVVVAGHGPLARRFAARCAQAGVAVAVIDDDADAAPPGTHVVFGDAGRPEVLAAAGVAEAKVLVVADLPLPHKMRACTAARALNPRIEIIAAANGEAEAVWLREFGVNVVCDATEELSHQLERAVRARL